MSSYLISLLIGFLGLDTTIAFQVLISQPIFACSILGWLLGDIAMGIEIGIMMQLLWLNIIPAGASVFPEGNVASMVTCVIAIQFAHLGIPNIVFTVAFGIGIVVSYAGAWLTVMDRKLNGYFLNLTLQAAEKASFKKIMLLDIASILVYLSMMSVLAYIALFSGGAIIPALDEHSSIALEEKLKLIKPAVWGIGIAMTAPLIYQAVKQKY